MKVFCGLCAKNKFSVLLYTDKYYSLKSVGFCALKSKYRSMSFVALSYLSWVIDFFLVNMYYVIHLLDTLYFVYKNKVNTNIYFE